MGGLSLILDSSDSQYCNFYNKAAKQSIFIPKAQTITPSQVFLIQRIKG